jgi:hypothetical protein
VFFFKSIYNDQVKKDEIDKACSTYIRKAEYMHNVGENARRKETTRKR